MATDTVVKFAAGAAAGMLGLVAYQNCAKPDQAAIKVGDPLPPASSTLFDCSNLKETELPRTWTSKDHGKTENKMQKADLKSLFGGKKAVLTVLPGAFTPG